MNRWFLTLVVIPVVLVALIFGVAILRMPA